MKCKPIKLEDETWVCSVCAFKYPKKFIRECSEIQRYNEKPKELISKPLTPKETFIQQLESRLNGRTLDEALGYLEICKGCPKFRDTFCNRDRGCDKHTVFLARLARGYCKERWDNPAKNSVAYKFFLTSELVQKTYDLIKLIPPNIDLIAGAARSGLIPATALATHLHLPLVSVGKKGVTEAGSGWRLKEHEESIKKILLIDDTVYSGRSLSLVKEVLQTRFPETEVLTAAVLVHPKSITKVDYYVEQLPGRHYLEWNFFNSIAISRCIFDFDGILCEDIPGKDDDDGERYKKALENAVPKYLVRREPIPIIVTARLEKYREITEAWMAKHGVRCKKLIMGPWENNEQRAVKGEISKFKARIYSSYSYTLFVESDPLQAAEIVDLTGKEVLCPRLKRVLIK